MENEVQIGHLLPIIQYHACGALWCSGKASDSRSIGTGFDPH